ncbi:MAG: hypothetical protein ACXWTS_06605 [Methylococcaceae bacterium]
MSQALAKIKAAGFVVELEDGELFIEPFSKLTPPQLAFLKTHKAEIIDELKQQQAANDNYTRDSLDDRRYCHDCTHLIYGRCIAQRFRPLDDIQRRCSDFAFTSDISR